MEQSRYRKYQRVQQDKRRFPKQDWDTWQKQSAYFRQGWKFKMFRPGEIVYTDYPVLVLGDISGKSAPIRQAQFISFDGNKYVKVLIQNHEVEFKIGYLARSRRAYRRKQLSWGYKVLAFGKMGKIDDYI